MSGCWLKVNVGKLATIMALLFAGCSGTPPLPPYPVYIATDELPDAFVAGLPGVRAKHLSGDPRTQRASYRVSIPADWSFTTGGSPGLSVEIYVIAGQVDLGEFTLTPGAYAYLPPGQSGTQMKSDAGALILYFLDDADDAALIQTPLITNSTLIEWNEVDIGMSVKELRADPGSGARSWLLKVDADAVVPYQRSSQLVEGFLISGSIDWSECSEGIAGSDTYLPGGYFNRPPGAINGGPNTGTESSAVWYLRVRGEETVAFVDGCEPAG